MVLLALACAFLGTGYLVNTVTGNDSRAQGRAGSNQEVLGYGIDGERYKTACPDYRHYAVVPQYIFNLSTIHF